MAETGNPYLRQTISVRDLRDGDVFERDGVSYRVGVRNPGDDSVEIQTGEEIRENGLNEFVMTVCTTRVGDGQLVSHQFVMEPPVRDGEGDLEDGGPFVDVWRLGNVADVSGRTSRVSWVTSALVVVASLLLPAIYAGLIPPMGYIGGRQAPLRDLPAYWDQSVDWSNSAMLVLTGLAAAVVIMLVLARRLRAALFCLFVQLAMAVTSMVTILTVASGLTL